MALLDKLIKRFKENMNEAFNNNELEIALAKAHADMSRRAKGHTSEVQEESVKWLKNRFENNSPFNFSDKFDNWHKKTCEKYCEYMNSKNFDFKMTYGRAQKVLNMTFKYLYCTEKYKKDVEKIAEFLHMTLDGYTLRWYKEVVIEYFNKKEKPRLKVGDVSDWSKMNEKGKHQYNEIQDRIKEYLENADKYEYSINTAIIDEDTNEKPKKNTIKIEFPFENKTPFYAEFIVWEGEKVRAKIESLFKGLNGIYKTWNEDKWAINDDVKKVLKLKIGTIEKEI